MSIFAEAGRWGSRAVAAAVSAVVLVGFGTPGAQAQIATQPIPANCSGSAVGVANAGILGGSAGAISSTIAGVIGSVNTAFLTQQGSAFVSAPANPGLGQEGGGIWARGIGGEISTKSVTTNNAVGTGGAAGTLVNTKCNNDLHQIFSGLQVGTDIAKLNMNGWNVHLGTTAGFLGSTARDDLNGMPKVGVEVPFFGAYLVATYGRFFADVMVRKEYYNVTLDNPSLNLNAATVGAHGVSVSTSAGYNFALQNNWFIEPSAGFVWSNTKVDAFNSNPPDGFGGTLGGITTTNDVDSKIGRLSVRVGTTYATPNVVYQPFATASVFHEFAGDIVSRFAFCPTCAGVGGVPANFMQTSTTSRVGTYGQYSLGLAAQIVNTGWLGFVRADYRHGDNVDGYTGNVGLRYQFSPDAVISPVKYAKAPVAPVVAPTNWTGFYIGAFAGAAAGRTDIGFANDPARTTSSPHVFGPIGGLQLGYNYQMSNWVFGVEGDFGLARIFGSRACGTATGPAPAFDPLNQNCTDKSDWIATAAARVGYSYGRTLYYVKGGAAWEDARVKIDCTDSINQTRCRGPLGNLYPELNANYTATTYTSLDRVGWMVGYGTEFDLGKGWSAKAEYDYIQFGKQTQLASDRTTLLYSQASISQVKVGLNYRIGSDSAVAVAAAPIYTKAPAKAPVIGPEFNWTGFYIGGNVGGAIASKSWEFLPPGGGLALGDGTHSASGAIAGGQVGYRWQTGRAVLGAEAQGNWANLNGKNASIQNFGPAPNGITDHTNVTALGIFTGQLGYTAFNTLLYVKGGAMVVDERYDVTNVATNALIATRTDTRWGGAVGAGLEYAFTPNVSAGIDYVHGFLGTKTVDIRFPTGVLFENERIRQDIDLVTLRLNYKFGPTAVVAKY
jgi:opacity protein-like surface antigen